MLLLFHIFLSILGLHVNLRPSRLRVAGFELCDLKNEPEIF